MFLHIISIEKGGFNMMLFRESEKGASRFVYDCDTITYTRHETRERHPFTPYWRYDEEGNNNPHR